MGFLPDLASYFIETYFQGQYVQVPIFIYGFFNQLTIDLWNLNKLIKDKQTVNHRPVVQILNEATQGVIKALIEKVRGSWYEQEISPSVSISV